MNRCSKSQASDQAIGPDGRAEWMGLLARASEADLEAAWRAQVPELAVLEYDVLRAPQQGLVMVRGRAGGDGQAFNLGEMAVTRCSLRLADGTVGHGYVAGRSARHAELAALFDGLLQTDAWSDRIREHVIAPLRASCAMARARAAAKTAATKVEFFTLVREQSADSK
ncbi:MAG TPA: phosphonate C-P lyase system protein PhnG [Rhodospirillaceae bacterium]|nr:phosphonate C-P lyase system protein PhnG [Rhodospirillaceae bacterium]